jgi:hypothetical protein
MLARRKKRNMTGAEMKIVAAEGHQSVKIVAIRTARMSHSRNVEVSALHQVKYFNLNI